MQHAQNQLTIHDLAFERNNRFLFNEINYSLHEGDILQIRGANGSGKSTLLRILAGYIEPQVGKILWQHQAIASQLDTYRQQLHYVGHQNGVKPALTVYENLKLICALNQIASTPTHLQKVIKKVGLTHATDTQALQLSAGQNRRLALARLLLQPAALWILDEPTTALDTEAQEILTELLSEHSKNNGIAIIATHHDLSIPAKMLTLRGEDE